MIWKSSLQVLSVSIVCDHFSLRRECFEIMFAWNLEYLKKFLKNEIHVFSCKIHYQCLFH